MSQHHAIDYIEFKVKDLEEAKAFYATAFGWQFNDHGPEYAGIRHGDGEQGGLAKAEHITPGGPLVVLFSEDLDATFEAVQAAGGEITRETFDFPGGRRFQFLDPSGNALEFKSFADPAQLFARGSTDFG